uniref:uncharacterized protein isoform X1 n=1 Tax=Myxine glutinosa TaxID=7769 RepID=UPI00358E1DE2
MRDSLLVLMLILGQSTCSVQPGITVLSVYEHTCANLPCDCGIRGSTWVRWMRDADVDGVVEQQISCSRTNCYDIDCDQKQKTKLNRHKILPNGDLQISKVEKRDSGLYRCLDQPSRGPVPECDSTSSFCTSGDREEESAQGVTPSSCGAALLLHISDSPQEAKDYKIYIKTRNVYWAGTDSNVYITICGGLKCLRSHHLNHSTTYDDPFERNQVDVFTVRSLYLGNLENVTLWHDGSGSHSSWLLKNIKIAETFSGMEQIFPCSCQVDANSPKILHPQIPGSCDPLDEREPNKPHVPNTLRGTPLLSCEIQKLSSNKFSLLWMFGSTEGHDQVIAVAGTQADILTSCLGKSEQKNHTVLEPGQDSCPESSNCLLPLFNVTRDELERYWCLVGPGEDDLFSSVTPTIKNFTTSTSREAGRTQQQKIIIPAVILSLLGILLIVIFVFFFRRRHKENGVAVSTENDVVEYTAVTTKLQPAQEAQSEYENVSFRKAAEKCSAPCIYSLTFYPGDGKKVPDAQPTELVDDEPSYAVIEFDRGVTRFA